LFFQMFNTTPPPAARRWPGVECGAVAKAGRRMKGAFWVRAACSLLCSNEVMNLGKVMCAFRQEFAAGVTGVFRLRWSAVATASVLRIKKRPGRTACIVLIWGG